MSVAGKRSGINGERSGLFIEQIRIIKEMRENERRNSREESSIRPRYMVWENVPGAFSSGKGEDFRIVLEETARIADSKAVIPQPPKGKWSNAGCIMGDGWSIAWRVHDAQFWGVPQRRRRIALVADFGGQSAPKILFERKSMYGYPAESGETRERITTDTEECVREAISVTNRGYATGDAVETLRAQSHGAIPMVAAGFISGNTGNIGYQKEISPTLKADAGGNTTPTIITSEAKRYIEEIEPVTYNGENVTSKYNKQMPIPGICHTLDQDNRNYLVRNPNYYIQEDRIDRPEVYDARGNGDGSTVPTLTGDHQNRITDYTALACFGLSGIGKYKKGLGTLRANGGDCGGGSETLIASLEHVGQTLDVSYYKGCGSRNGKEREIIAQPPTYCVRRLTPLECERLQGYPDYYTHIPGWKNVSSEEVEKWTDIFYEWDKLQSKTPEKVKRKSEKYIKKWLANPTSDTAEYKALGNSIALPFWRWMLKRIVAYLPQGATIGSLFDGIGGFPLIWEEINGKGSALWASEIEPFCIAVTCERINT